MPGNRSKWRRYRINLFVWLLLWSLRIKVEEEKNWKGNGKDNRVTNEFKLQDGTCWLCVYQRVYSVYMEFYWILMISNQFHTEVIDLQFDIILLKQFLTSFCYLKLWTFMYKWVFMWFMPGHVEIWKCRDLKISIMIDRELLRLMIWWSLLFDGL